MSGPGAGIGMGLLAPSPSSAQYAAASGTTGENADINPAFMAMSSLVNNSLGSPVDVTDQTEGKQIGLLMAKTAQVTAYKGNKYYMIGMAIANGMPKVVCALLNWRAAASIFGNDGLNLLGGPVGAGGVYPPRGGPEKWADLQRLTVGNQARGPQGGQGGPPADGLVAIDAHAAFIRNAAAWKIGPSVPYNGPWGHAIRAIVQQFGEGPRGAMMIGMKIKTESDRLQQDRLFGSLVPSSGMNEGEGSSMSSTGSLYNPSAFGNAATAARIGGGGAVF